MLYLSSPVLSSSPLLLQTPPITFFRLFLFLSILVFLANPPTFYLSVAVFSALSEFCLLPVSSLFLVLSLCRSLAQLFPAERVISRCFQTSVRVPSGSAPLLFPSLSCVFLSLFPPLSLSFFLCVHPSVSYPYLSLSYLFLLSFLSNLPPPLARPLIFPPLSLSRTSIQKHKLFTHKPCTLPNLCLASDRMPVQTGVLRSPAVVFAA